jgi:xylulokinase
VRLAGGGSTAPAWRQLLSDTLGRPLQSLDVSDVSARGAALLGGVAATLVSEADLGGALAPSPGPLTEPDDAGAAVQAQRRERFLEAVRALRPEITARCGDADRA